MNAEPLALFGGTVLKTLALLLTSLLFATSSALAESLAEETPGDICSIRPDLCDEYAADDEPIALPAPASEREVRPRRSTTSISAPSRAKNKIKKKKKKNPNEKRRDRSAETNCRQPEAMGAAASSLPPCETEPPTRDNSFETYMASNSTHPALSRSIASRQEAFQEVSQGRGGSFPLPSSPSPSESAGAGAGSGAGALAGVPAPEQHHQAAISPTAESEGAATGQ
ncbi:MAG: hypothetical protein HC902_12180 [Calothrix sp. SM1_5_4]|nr:hypothetical protein [Calothrix sp. SM1_5_4]